MTQNRAMIPWRRWMELGLGVLRFSPNVFWNMSLAEWLAARDGLMGARARDAGGDPLIGNELAQLMKSHPDRKA